MQWGLRQRKKGGYYGGWLDGKTKTVGVADRAGHVRKLNCGCFWVVLKYLARVPCRREVGGCVEGGFDGGIDGEVT